MTKNIYKYFKYYYMVAFMTYGVFNPYLNVWLEKDKGLSGIQIGVIASMILIASVISQPLWGMIASSTGKHYRLLMISFILTGVSVLFFKVQTTYVGLIIMAVIFQLARTPLTPLSDILSSQYCAENNKEYGVIRSFGSLGFILITAIVGILLMKLPMEETIFYGHIVVLVLCIYFITKIGEIKVKPVKKVSGSFRRLFFNKHFYFLIFFSSLVIAPHNAAFTFSSNHLVTTLAAAPIFITYLNVFSALPEIFLLGKTNMVIRKLGYYKYFMTIVIFAMTRYLITGFINNPYLLILISMLTHVVIISGMTAGLISYIRDNFIEEQITNALSWSTTILMISTAFFSYINGILYQYVGSHYIFILTGLVAMVALIIMILNKEIV